MWNLQAGLILLVLNICQLKGSDKLRTSLPPYGVLGHNLACDANGDAVQALFRQFPGLKEVRMIEAKSGIALLEYGDEMQGTVAHQGLKNFRVSPSHTDLLCRVGLVKIFLTAGVICPLCNTEALCGRGRCSLSLTACIPTQSP